MTDYYSTLYADSRAADAAADAGEAALRDSLLPAAEQQARDELTAECHQPGTIARGEWADWKADFGDITAKNFIALCEQDGGTLFSDRVESILDDFREVVEL